MNEHQPTLRKRLAIWVGTCLAVFALLMAVGAVLHLRWHLLGGWHTVLFDAGILSTMVTSLWRGGVFNR